MVYLGCFKPTKYRYTDEGAFSLHIEYTTDRPQGQAPRYELDSTGRLTHRYTADELPLHDVSPSGRVRPWRTHKQEGLALSDIYETLGTDPDFEDAAKALDKARRLSACAQWAEFEQLPEGRGSGSMMPAFAVSGSALCVSGGGRSSWAHRCAVS